MDKIQHQLDILSALAAHRNVQCRDRSKVDATWIPVAKQDQLLNFTRFDYRLAPINAECWLVYNTKAETYVRWICGSDSICAGSTSDPAAVFVSAADAAKQAACLNDIYGVNYYVPVRMKPAHDDA